MALTVYEYANVTEQGLPLEPGTRNAAVTAPYALASSTRYVGVVSTAAANIRIGDAGSGQTATSADYGLEAGKNYGFAVRQGGKVWISFV